jgi:uncharacterized membrane protein
MRIRIAHAWSTLRSSFWFIPLEVSVLAALLSAGMLALDRYTDWDAIYPLSGFYRGSPDGARAILSTIGGSMIGVAGTVFSITIAVLSFASSTFGARLLRNFMRDRGNQLVLGTFVATFLYCLLILRAVRNTYRQLGRADLFHPPCRRVDPGGQGDRRGGPRPDGSD